MRGTAVTLALLHYVYPVFIFAYYIIKNLVATAILHERPRHIKTLCSLVVASFLGQFLNLLIHFLLQDGFLIHEDTVISLLSCALVFGIEYESLAVNPSPCWPAHMGSLACIMLFDPAIQILTYIARPRDGHLLFATIDHGIAALRYLFSTTGFALYILASGRAKQEAGTDVKRESLLFTRSNGAPDAPRSQTAYGSTPGATRTSGQEPSDVVGADRPTNFMSSLEKRAKEMSERMAEDLKKDGNWFRYAHRYRVLKPYIWPQDYPNLQVLIFLVGLCLLGENALHLLVPRQLSIVIDSMTKVNGLNPWVQVAKYAVLRYGASNVGLSLWRERLWKPVQDYASKTVTNDAYRHAMRLSSDYHDSTNSSQIIMAIQSGQHVSNLTESICFGMIPMLVNMIAALVYLSILFGPYVCFIAVASTVLFFVFATRTMARLNAVRQDQTRAFLHEQFVRQAGIQGWDTAASFTRIPYEENRYAKAVKGHVNTRQKYQLYDSSSRSLQSLVLLSGLLASAFLVVRQVDQGHVTAGNFMLLISYWAELNAPLNFFANMRKRISSDLIRVEQLLILMQTKPTITNRPDAKVLEQMPGRVRLSNVYFSYGNGKDILKDVSIEVEPGTTVAFVGTTGGGKSTILKLLSRLYEVSRGSIEIDGHDIRDLDVDSLRSHIGTVPQSPVLFDNTIMYNVRYARPDATEAQVVEACEAASIHKEILGFPDGYETCVGERGVKLSGGQLQRIAIARVVLKRPSILLLDEATSAVDTDTEQKIQETLQTLCQGKTTFIVAHRLSTVVEVDQIVVISEGKVIEMGNHETLRKAGGKYASLWSKQALLHPGNSAEGGVHTETVR